MNSQHTTALGKITGLICAPFTPFAADGSLDLDIIPKYAACLRENAIDGVFVNGSSGEGLLMTEEERMKCVEAWARHRAPDFKLIVHVAANSTRNAIKMAKHARKLGADAISAMGPTFPPIGSVEPLVAYCEEIAAATPDIPFYYYHIPSLSRVDLPMITFLEQAEVRIPTFAGIKFTSPDIYDLTRCSRYRDRKFDVLAGQDETMLAALCLADSQGFIGGTFNFCAPIYVEILNAFRSGDLALARNLQEKAQDIIDVLIAYGGNMVAGKQMMRLVGLNLGGARTPFRQMNSQQFDEMKADLAKTAFFDFCNVIHGSRAQLPSYL